MKIIVTVYLVFVLVSCKPSNKLKDFVSKYKLEKYDSIVAISCISCGGCIQHYVSERQKNSGTIFLFDDQCKSNFIQQIKHINHVSIPQNVLDSMFNDFGNVVVITKKNNNYLLIEQGVLD